MEPDSIIKTIKEVAHSVCEDSLLFGKNVNDIILPLCLDKTIENKKILKRVCEQVNQTVYLSILNKPGADRSNIKFPLADYGKIKKTLNQSENEMKAYETPPEDYRRPAGIFPDNLSSTTVVEKESPVKTASLEDKLAQRASLNAMASRIEAMRHGELKNVETLFNKIANDTKLMVVNQESIGDIAKVAVNHVKDLGLGNLDKIASVYDIIHKELVNSGYHVKTEFTKISSLKPKADAEMLSPVRELAMTLEKIAAFGEMLSNIRGKASILNENIRNSL